MAEHKESNTHLAPLVGAIILTGLWAAYTVLIVYEMVVLPAPA
ncbi:hypothetical protein [Vitreimonas flagellata]|nr:hypothetical protein [Vitreimonas flagellata]